MTSRPLVFLVVSIVMRAALMSAGPTLVALLHGLVPVVIVVVAAIVVMRLLWYFTNRY
jgi:hypothetical protein